MRRPKTDAEHRVDVCRSRLIERLEELTDVSSRVSVHLDAELAVPEGLAIELAGALMACGWARTDLATAVAAVSAETQGRAA